MNKYLEALEQLKQAYTKEIAVIFHETRYKEFYVTSKGRFYSVDKQSGLRSKIDPKEINHVMYVKVDQKNISCLSILSIFNKKEC